jgi:hypothetical protein
MPARSVDGSRRLLVVAATIVLAVAASASASVAARAPAFHWLQPRPAPQSWKLARLPSGKATFGYPSTWRPIRTDSGTVSVALLGRRGSIRGYLNLTPRQGTETLANWPRFRIEHQGDEGATEIHLIASARRLAFRSGRGSCVIDSYRTSRARYREIACLVAGAHTTSVIVGAAPSRTWARQATTIERAIASLRTD